MEPSLHMITGWQDTHLSTVLDLYQTSFPANEQMRFSWWVTLLNELSLQNGPAQPHRLLYAALGDVAHDVVGFAYCEAHETQRLAYLMYLATRDDLRGQGVGAAVYRQVTEELFTNGNIETLVFEVEKPEVMGAESSEAAHIARRRIDWYQRQGARLLDGIRYVQSVGWQPPVEMNLMFHCKKPGSVSATDAFSSAAALFGSNVEQADAVHWRQNG